MNTKHPTDYHDLLYDSFWDPFDESGNGKSVEDDASIDLLHGTSGSDPRMGNGGFEDSGTGQEPRERNAWHHDPGYASGPGTPSFNQTPPYPPRHLTVYDHLQQPQQPSFQPRASLSGNGMANVLKPVNNPLRGNPPPYYQPQLSGDSYDSGVSGNLSVPQTPTGNTHYNQPNIVNDPLPKLVGQYPETMASSLAAMDLNRPTPPIAPSATANFGTGSYPQAIDPMPEQSTPPNTSANSDVDLMVRILDEVDVQHTAPASQQGVVAGFRDSISQTNSTNAHQDSRMTLNTSSIPTAVSAFQQDLPQAHGESNSRTVSANANRDYRMQQTAAQAYGESTTPTFSIFEGDNSIPGFGPGPSGYHFCPNCPCRFDPWEAGEFFSHYRLKHQIGPHRWWCRVPGCSNSDRKGYASLSTARSHVQKKHAPQLRRTPCEDYDR